MKAKPLLFLLASTMLAATPALAQEAPNPGPNTAPSEPGPGGTPFDTNPDKTPQPSSGQPAAGDAPAPGDIAALRAQIQAMQVQLDRLQAASAQAAAAPAAAPAPVAASAPAWFANTTVGGKLYFDVTDVHQKSDGVNTTANGVQTDVKRFYLIVDHKFDNIFSANLTTDFNYVSNDNETQLYIKKAYLQAKLSDAFFVRVGSADLPWVPFVEDIYGYRFVENVLIDRTKYGTSADYGVHIGGTFGKGLLSYAFSAVNGAGYKVLKRSDAIDLEGRISLVPIKGLTFAVGGYTGKLGKSTSGPGNSTDHTARRLDALVAYTNSRIRIGAEYFWSKDWNNVTTPVEDKTTGFSAFGSFAITPKIAVFGRYDWVNPNKLTNSPLDDDYFNAGVNFQVIKNIDLALVYKRERVDNGLISVSNGTIGGVDRGTYDEVGLWGQVKF